MNVMVGKKFGRLTVIDEAGSDKHHKLLWKCQCDCGNETIVVGSGLRSGNTQSCGCYRNERVTESTKIDLTGQKFGRLIAIEEAGRSNGGIVLWRCVCECGNEMIVRGSSLRNGNTKSCGCYNRERISETHLGKKWSMEVRIRISCSVQGINREDWDGFAEGDWREWDKAVYLNAPFPECHRHHITETLVACIPGELHHHIRHNLKTGYNMAEMNMLALQYINRGTKHGRMRDTDR